MENSQQFEDVLKQESVTEQTCQDFLETHTQFFYTPFLLNHGVHFDAVISKFPLDTSLVTDFAYLTKSSDFWHMVLVEIEHPQKRLFRNVNGRVVPTSELSEAIAQIDTWRDFIKGNENEVLRRLNPIRKPLTANPVYFKYLLVIGRSEQKAQNQAVRNRLATLRRDDFQICTYDSLINYAMNGSPSLKLNVFRLVKTHFEFKYLHREPHSVFAYLTPQDISLTKEQRIHLQSVGYEIDKWEAGESLAVNGKTTIETHLKNLQL